MSFSEINIDVFRSINDLGDKASSLNPVAIFFAEYMLYVLILGLLVFWFTRSTKNRMMVIQAVIATAIAEVLGKIAGHIYSHHQPFAVLPHVNKLVEHAVDNSFPSDHTTIFFSVCISFWLVRKKEWWLWIVLPLFIAISRVWVGVHYPVDVVAAALFGIISALFVYWLAPKLAFIKQLLALYEKAEQRILPSKNKTENY